MLEIFIQNIYLIFAMLGYTLRVFWLIIARIEKNNK